MAEPEAGDLFACRWDPEDEGEQDSFRVVEVEQVSEEELTVWAYGDAFVQPPSSVDVKRLRKVKLHEVVGGPVVVPRAEFRSWQGVPVARA